MNKNLYTFLLYVTFSCLLLDPIKNIGIDPLSFTRAYLLGIPFIDLGLLLMLITFFVNINRITIFVNKKILFVVGVSVLIFLIQGVSINGTSNFTIYNADIRTFLWFFGGIAFAFTLVKTERIILNLEIIIIIATVLLALSSIKSQSFIESGGVIGVERISHPNIYILSGFIFTPIVLLYNITQRKLFKKIIPLLSTLTFFFYVAILSNTRSSTIIAFTLFFLFAISLKFRIKYSNVFLLPFKPAVKVIIFLAIISIIFFILYLVARDSRLLTIFDLQILLSDSRISELLDFFKQSDFLQLFFGRGFGGSIYSSIYDGELTNSLHIGVLNFWMKMGLIPFIMVFLSLFIDIPVNYIRSLNSITNRKSTFNHTANVSILPALFPWIISLILSGGYDEVNFLFAGFVIYIFGIVKVHGINALIKKIPVYNGNRNK